MVEIDEKSINRELKISAKISGVIGPKQTCTVKGRIIQETLRLLRLIIEQIDSEDVLINLYQSKTFDRVNH